MKLLAPAARRRLTPTDSDNEKGAPTLPAWKAFVVQFSCETDIQRRRFSGRVEHLSSGRRARFRSRRELLATLERMLDQLTDRALGPRSRS